MGSEMCIRDRFKGKVADRVKKKLDALGVSDYVYDPDGPRLFVNTNSKQYATTIGELRRLEELFSKLPSGKQKLFGADVDSARALGATESEGSSTLRAIRKLLEEAEKLKILRAAE